MMDKIAFQHFPEKKKNDFKLLVPMKTNEKIG